MFHWLMGILYIVLCVYPAMRISARLGLSQWLGVLAVIPLLFLWVVAYARWPQRNEIVP